METLSLSQPQVAGFLKWLTHPVVTYLVLVSYTACLLSNQLFVRTYILYQYDIYIYIYNIFSIVYLLNCHAWPSREEEK